MSNLRYYVAIIVFVLLYIFYNFSQDSSIYYEKPVYSAEDIQKGKQLSIKLCNSCHSLHDKYPRLEGLSSAYIQKQLKNYIDANRLDLQMQKIVKSLSKEDILSISAYYSSVSFSQNKKDVDRAKFEIGENLALIGKANLSRCSSCHGLNGEGFAEEFPAIAGQNEQYISSQLHMWKNSLRQNDKFNMMKNISNKLSEEEIKSLSLYYSSLPYSVNMEK